VKTTPNPSIERTHIGARQCGPEGQIPLGIFSRDIFTVLSIYGKKGRPWTSSAPAPTPEVAPPGGLQIIMKKPSALAFVRRTLARRYPGVGVAQPDPVALHYMQAPVRVRRARGAHDACSKLLASNPAKSP
jgi:hypothetical protein